MGVPPPGLAGADNRGSADYSVLRSIAEETSSR